MYSAVPTKNAQQTTPAWLCIWIHNLFFSPWEKNASYWPKANKQKPETKTPLPLLFFHRLLKTKAFLAIASLLQVSASKKHWSIDLCLIAPHKFGALFLFLVYPPSASTHRNSLDFSGSRWNRRSLKDAEGCSTVKDMLLLGSALSRLWVSSAAECVAK